MNGSPLLSILTSSKKSDHQAAELPSVDDLLDNPWHYDCVVSPRLSSDLAPKSSSPASLSKRANNHHPLSPPSLSKRSANRPLSPPSLSQSSANRPLSISRLPANHPPSLSKPAAAAANPSSSSSSSKPAASVNILITASSNYVSLASFINNADKSSYGSCTTAASIDFLSKRSSKSITPVLSKCRERESKTHIRGDPSRIRSYAGCLAVD